MIDDTDRQILQILQENSRTSNAEIARRVGMAPSAIFERIRKLEEKGVIRGYGVKLDPRAVGFGLLSFVHMRSSDGFWGSDVAKKLAAIPEVLEVHYVTGEDCFFVKMRAPQAEDLGRLLRDQFGEIESLQSTRTTIVLETAKESADLPLGLPVVEGHRRSDGAP